MSRNGTLKDEIESAYEPAENDSFADDDGAVSYTGSGHCYSVSYTNYCMSGCCG